MPKSDERPWRWYYAQSLSVGWDCAFQSKDDLMHDPPEHFVIRRFSRLVVDEGSKQLSMHPMFPKLFGVWNAESLQRVPRNMFNCVSEVTEAASKDWDEVWEKEPTSIVAANEDDAKSLAEKAKAQADVVKKMRSGMSGVMPPGPRGR